MSIKVRTTVRAHDATRTKQRRDLIVSILDNPCSLTASCFGWTNLVGEFTRGITLLRPNWYPAGRLFHGVEFRDDPTGGDGLPSRIVGLASIVATEGKGVMPSSLSPLPAVGIACPVRPPPLRESWFFLLHVDLCGPSLPAQPLKLRPQVMFFSVFLCIYLFCPSYNAVTDLLSIALDLARSMAGHVP